MRDTKMTLTIIMRNAAFRHDASKCQHYTSEDREPYVERSSIVYLNVIAVSMLLLMVLFLFAAFME